MSEEAGRRASARGAGRYVGPYGRQPVYWVLRERGITQTALGSVVARSTSYVSGVLNGFWAPDLAFLAALSETLGLAKEALFSTELVEASQLRGEPRVASDGQARRARPGRFGRQPAYGILREKRLQQGEVCRVTGQSSSYVSQVLNGSRVPDPSFVDGMAELVALDPKELFTTGLIEASRRRMAGLAGAPPSGRVGPYGCQPAYWALRERGIRQGDLAAMLGRSGGHVSRVLNGFLLPDHRFVRAVSDLLDRPPAELLTADVLDMVTGER